MYYRIAYLGVIGFWGLMAYWAVTTIPKLHFALPI